MFYNFDYAVVGHPIKHTMSPFIHSKLFEISGVRAKYSLLDIEPEKLESGFEQLKTLKGCNFTIPHKSAVIPLLDGLSDRAKLYGAVNTVKFGEKNIGYNTDCLGFLAALDGAKMKLCGNVLVCGNGGASRMMAFESAMAGCNTVIAVRESGVEKGKALKREIEQNVSGANVEVTLYGDVSGDFDLLLNGTPVGMYPNTEQMPVGEKLLSRCAGVFDCIYNPRKTVLLAKAAANGSKVGGGMPMLVWQAAKAQTIWHGYEFTQAQLEPIIEQADKEMERVFR